MNRLGLLALVVAASASAQDIHNGTISIVGPNEYIDHYNTYTLEVWGQWDSPEFIEGVSAMAGFGFDIVQTVGQEQIVSVGNLQYAPWAAAFGNVPAIVGNDMLGISSGQLANLFGFLNPDIDLSNPILLFTFEITTGEEHVWNIEFTPTNPNANGGLSFYPDNEDGASIIAPNDADTSLTMNSWAYFIPSPGSVVPLLLLAAVRRRR
jgi:hypothetical protein